MNEVYQRIKSRVKPEIRDAVKQKMKNLMIEKIIESAYKLYMPQVKSEITDLTNFLIKNTDWKNDRPINVLEIGTKFGGTFYIWNEINRQLYEKSQVWDLNGENEGKLCISIDMSDGGKHGGISEQEMDSRDLWFLERFDNCCFVRGNSHNLGTVQHLTDYINQMMYSDIDKFQSDKLSLDDLTLKKIDFLFIDGDHTYEGVKQDFEMYSPFVKRGGCIAFHDIVISEHHHSRDVYVGEFWKEITKNKIQSRYGFNICDINETAYEFYEFIGSKDQKWAGIGCLVKL